MKLPIRLLTFAFYDGAEVVQLYLRDLIGSVTRPVTELKGFQKVFLKKGETKRKHHLRLNRILNLKVKKIVFL